MTKTCIILAGGMGTRLQSVVNDRPKVMAEIEGKPFLSCLLDILLRQGIKNVVLAVGYKREFIVNYYNYKYKDIELKYSIEDAPLGTGGAIRQALDYAEDENVFIVNGDTYFDVDYKGMSDFHDKNNAQITIALKELLDFDRYGSIQIANNRIVDFIEKKKITQGLINGGVYLIRKNIFNGFSLTETFSFEIDFLQKYFTKMVCYGYISTGEFIDIGIPEDYSLAKEVLYEWQQSSFFRS